MHKNRVKLLMNSFGSDVTTTTSSGTLLSPSRMRSESNLLKALLTLISGHVSHHKDGGLLLTIVASSLISSALEKNMPVFLITQAYQQAKQWILEYLNDPLCPVRLRIRWNDMSSITAIARTVLASKPACRWSRKSLKVVSDAVVEAFITSLGSSSPCDGSDDGDGEDTNISPSVRFVPWMGKCTASTSTAPNSILLDLPLPVSAATPIVGVTIALFDISIETPESGLNLKSAIVSVDGDVPLWTVKGEEEEALKKLGDILASCKVTLCASQKLIHPFLKQYLHSLGIVALERLSLRHIAAVRDLSGALVLSTWDRLDQVQRSLGRLAMVDTRTIGKKTYILMNAVDGSDGTVPKATKRRLRPISTIILAAPDEPSYDELQATVDTTISTLTTLLNNPILVAGGGVTDLHVAAMIRRRCMVEESTKGDFSPKVRAWFEVAYETISECLEQAVTSLYSVESCRKNKAAEEALLAALYSANAATINVDVCGGVDGSGESKMVEGITRLYGWDVHRHEPVVMVEYIRRLKTCAADESDEDDDGGIHECTEHLTDTRACVTDIHSLKVIDCANTYIAAVCSSFDVSSTLLRVRGIVGGGRGLYMIFSEPR